MHWLQRALNPCIDRFGVWHYGELFCPGFYRFAASCFYYVVSYLVKLKLLVSAFGRSTNVALTNSYSRARKGISKDLESLVYPK